MKAKDLAKTLGVILKGNGEMDVKGIGDIENHSNVLPDRIYYFEAKNISVPIRK